MHFKDQINRVIEWPGRLITPDMPFFPRPDSPAERLFTQWDFYQLPECSVRESAFITQESKILGIQK